MSAPDAGIWNVMPALLDARLNSGDVPFNGVEHYVDQIDLEAPTLRGANSISILRGGENRFDADRLVREKRRIEPSVNSIEGFSVRVIRLEPFSRHEASGESIRIYDPNRTAKIVNVSLFRDCRLT